MAFKYIELFAGIGGFRSALDPLGGGCIFASEIDEHATRAYRALYNGATELHGDITKIDAQGIPDHDVLVGGFPCQAFSVAGQRKGFEDTRGTLFFEIARIASAKRPKLMLLENVKGLLSHDGGKTFETMCAVLNDIGYAIDFNVLNSKYFGVPQNRERIFIVASRDAEHAEWDVKGSGVVAKAKRRAQALGVRTFNFEWPAQGTVTKRLRDILEDNVAEKYYLSEEKTAKLIAQLSETTGETDRAFRHGDVLQRSMSGVHRKDEYGTLRAGASRTDFGVVTVGSLEHYGNDQMNRVYSVDGVAPTITVVSGGGREQKIAEPQIEQVGQLPSDSGQTGAIYGTDGISPTLLNQHGNAVTKVAVQMNRARVSGVSDVSHCLMARDYKGFGNQDMTGVIEATGCSLRTRSYCGQPQQLEIRDEPVSNTLTSVTKDAMVLPPRPRYRIRKLTPRECWRLQGFADAQHDTVAAAGISDSQRYKMAGNAVTVNVISAIGRRLVPLLTSQAIDSVTRI